MRMIRPKTSLLFAIALGIFAAAEHLALGGILPDDYGTGVTDIAAFPSNDGWQHAIPLHSGTVTEVFFGKEGEGRPNVGNVPGAFAVSAYAAPAFGSHNVVVLLQNDGDVIQLWYRADGDVGSRVLGRIVGALDVAAFEDNKGSSHIIVLGGNGTLTEFTADGLETPANRNVLTVPGASRIAAFQAGDDHRCIVIAGHDDGQVEEVFYLPGQAASVSTLLGAGTRLLDVAAFYTSDDHFRHAILLDESGTVREFFYHPEKGHGIAALGTDSSPHRVSGYATSDHLRHVILGGTDGHVRELAYHNGKTTDTHLASIEPAITRSSVVGPLVGDAAIATQSEPCPAGLTYALAGNEAVRYALSLNAGLWRSSGTLPWVALPNSPRYGQSISVDPMDVQHVFVGERDGDAGNNGDASLNFAGLWESRDMGQSWSYILDPLTLSHPAKSGGTIVNTSQAVAAVTALDDGGVLVCTQSVILRRKGRAGVLTPLDGFWGLGPFTGVSTTSSAGHTWIWARTATAVLWSDDDGVSVKSQVIPASAPDSNGVVHQLLPTGIGNHRRGDGFDFATYGSRAAFVTGSLDSTGSVNRVDSLEFDVLDGTWIVDTVDVGDGTGLGGRLVIKAEHADNYTKQTGQGVALLMSSGQQIWLGTPRRVPGELSGTRGINWRAVAEGGWVPTKTDHYYFASGPSKMHSDLWDAHISDHPLGAVLLVACDGGVFESKLSEILSTPVGTSPPYVALNRGLQTQHLHALALVDPSYAQRSAVLTAAVDNDAWWLPAAPYSGHQRTWGHAQPGQPGNLGDANYTYSDPKVSDAAVIWRNNGANAVIRHLEAETPGVDGSQMAYPTAHFRSEHQFAILPRQVGDGTPDKLEVVALARKNTTSPDSHAGECDGTSEAGAVDGSSWDSDAVLTADYAQHRVIDLPNAASNGWSLVDDVPRGAQRIWASESRWHPTYFVYAENDSTGDVGIFRRNLLAPFIPGTVLWEQLTGPALFPRDYCAVNGPLFPSPYDASVAYAYGKDGAWQLVNGSFVKEPILTNLLTRSGTYADTCNFPGARSDLGGNSGGLELHPTQGRNLSTLADLRFDAADPYRVAAASAFGSVFFLDRREGIWRDLTPALPTPATAVSGVGIAHDGVYVAYEGRSAWKVEYPELAPEATFFTDSAAADRLGVLQGSSGRLLGGIAVRIAISATTKSPSIEATCVTRNDGSVPLPPGTSRLQLVGRVIHLNTDPNLTLAGASRAFHLQN